MGEEGNYSPNLGAIDVEHLEGAAKAAKNLANRRFAKFEDDIQMIINLHVLSIEDQETLCVHISMASPGTGQGGRNGDDDKKKVAEAFDRQVPKFSRKVKFLDLMIIKGESYASWRNCINQQAELADLENIRAQDLQSMKFFQGLNKTDRLYD